ncbi:hypothetical protein CEXT_662571 [Caerostris extrusa]|uniref:Uncharacterized protein n=1 Tax=Caerostris extrusa TaxID=172846 RepID=A0AAV4VDA1_CAEEX|nr:hypothetical protein CEXT_662571 [Caerostris extrusa]
MLKSESTNRRAVLGNEPSLNQEYVRREKQFPTRSSMLSPQKPFGAIEFQSRTVLSLTPPMMTLLVDSEWKGWEFLDPTNLGICWEAQRKCKNRKPSGEISRAVIDGYFFFTWSSATKAAEDFISEK